MTLKMGDVTLLLRLLAKPSPSQLSLLTNSLLVTHRRAGRLLEVLFVFLPSNPDHVLIRLLDFYIKMLLFVLSFHRGSPGTRKCYTKQALGFLPPLPMETKKWCRRHGFNPPGICHSTVEGNQCWCRRFPKWVWGTDQTKLTVPRETTRGGKGDHPPRAPMATNNRTNSLGYFGCTLFDTNRIPSDAGQCPLSTPPITITSRLFVFMVFIPLLKSLSKLHLPDSNKTK